MSLKGWCLDQEEGEKTNNSITTDHIILVEILEKLEQSAYERYE